MLQENLGELISVYFLQTGIGWAVTGAMFAVMFACIGSAKGIRLGAGQASGILSEKPELFGKLFVLMALPGTQGFYGMVAAIMIALRTGLLAGEPAVSPLVGLALFFIGVTMGIVEWRSAVFQGETSAACISLTGKRPEEGGRAIVMPGLVETYGMVALLVAILMILWLTPEGGLQLGEAAAATGG